MNYFSECLTKFQSLTDIARDAYGGIETFAATVRIEEAYNIKLSFLVILIAIGELEEEDIEEYLIAKFKISPEMAKKIKDELVEKVLDPAFEKITEPKQTSNFTAPKQTIIDLFSNRLIESVNAEPDVIEGLNILIFKALNTDEDLEDKIIEILYNNNERLASANIEVDNHEVAPTIANWLKDFIKVNGSEMFDELKMAEYLSSSPNAKKLNAGEKDLLRKVLRLYRNLVFFPESMGNDPVEDWQIIPVDKVEEDRISKPEIFRDALEDRERKQEKTGENIKDEPLRELENSLTQYTPGSLEYKAVKQEIERLKKKK